MIDSLEDPLGMFLDQSLWAFLNSIRYQESPDGEYFQKLHEFWEQQIKQYLEENTAPWQ